MAEFKPADINVAPICIVLKPPKGDNQILRKNSGLKHISPEIQPESQSVIFLKQFIVN